MNLVSLESLLIQLLDNAQISIFSKVGIMIVPFVVLGHIFPGLIFSALHFLVQTYVGIMDLFEPMAFR